MELYNDDCFNVFPKIADKSIDLFVLDLPYANKKFGNCTACAWDTPINLKKMWEEIKRIMKPNATIIHFCNTKFGYALIESNPKWFKYDLIWKKSRKVGFLSANKMPLRKHEMIYVFKGDKPHSTYNPQKTTGHKSRIREAHKTNTKNVYGMTETLAHDTGDTRHPTTILKFNNPNQAGGTLHRTQKPVDLCEWLIKSFSNEGEVVCDFTMGSGTTGIACLNTNRKFIGVELDKEIFKIAKDRIDNHKN